MAVLVVLIGVADKKEFFCSSRSLVESFASASSYCTLNGMWHHYNIEFSELSLSLFCTYNIIGVVYHYGVIQIGLWTLFFTVGFFWGIFFPFHYQKFKLANRLKYIHATTILLGVILPIVPVAVQIITDGYQLSEAPRRAICTGQNITATFFGFLLPFSVLSAIITSLLVLIFWKILKVCSPNCIQVNNIILSNLYGRISRVGQGQVLHECRRHECNALP